MKRAAVPTFDQLMNPTLDALRALGGSASIPELVEARDRRPASPSRGRRAAARMQQ
jgi:hypothetical protein